ERLRQIAGVERLRPATGEELAQFYPESEPGAMPPLGPLYGHGVFVDEALARQSFLTFSAGTANDAIRMRYGDFVALVHPTVGRFARPA
ncbi:MAG TPA: YbaK/EbsC family protein, partial [Methylomirabilota bacterium]